MDSENNQNTESMVKSAIERINESLSEAKIAKKAKKPRFTGKTKGILGTISTIVEALKVTEFKPPKLKGFRSASATLARYLGSNDSQAVMFATIFTMYFASGKKPVPFYAISEFYRCNPVTILQYEEDVKWLEENWILGSETDGEEEAYTIPESVEQAVLSNRPIERPSGGDFQNALDEIDERSPLIEREPTVIDMVKRAYEAVKACGFSGEANLDPYFRLARYLGVDAEAARFFAPIFIISNEHGRRPVAIGEISSACECDLFDIFGKKDLIEPLVQKRLLEKTDYEDFSFKVATFAEEAIFHNRPLPKHVPEVLTTGIVALVSNIVVNLKRSNFDVGETTAIKKPVAALKKYLGLERDIEAIVFASLFTMYFDNAARPVSFYTISDFYGCNPLIVLQRQDSLKALVDSGLIEESDSMSESSAPLYKIPQYVADSIVSGKKIEQERAQRNLTIHTFLHQIEKIGDRRVDMGENVQMLYDGIESRERSHKSVKSIENVKNVLPKIEDRAILYDVAAGMINHINSEVDLMILVNRSTDESTGRQSVIDTFMDETNVLFTRELVQFENKASMMDSTVSLTDKAFELLLGEEGKFYHREIGGKQLKSPDKIQEKALFYMEENESEIRKLYDSFENENLKKLQARLEEKKLPKGICAIFYGAPGTGKTETVYQIAKKTARPVFHVDIGNMRSQWYGETEQKFSKLFNDYRRMCEGAEKGDGMIPILLFNEADAIFGTRVESPQNGGRVDNTIQNILLEEMERLPGILIATTNLEDNLDRAFERRFLFKIKFATPNADVKAKIWRSNLPNLSEGQAQKLAREYSFTGGEIANIARKATMDEILSGNEPSFEQISEYCRSEKIMSGKSTLGFRK